MLPRVANVKDLFRALLRRPELWVEALRAAWAIRSRFGRGSPFSLRGRYYRWRMSTAYGAQVPYPEGEDVIEFLVWRKHQRA